MAAARTIILKGTPARDERLATAVAIKPGYLLQITSANLVEAFSTAGGTIGAKIVALENDLQGDGVSTSYAVSVMVQYAVVRPGDEVLMHLYNGENVAIGDKVEAHSDGTIRKLVADTSALTVKVNCVIGVALEAVDMSGSTGVDPTGGWIRILIG